MRKILTIALMVMVAFSASAAGKKKAPAKNQNKPVFTVIKENPITTIKDQNRSGTCWDYSTPVSSRLSVAHGEISRLRSR